MPLIFPNGSGRLPRLRLNPGRLPPGELNRGVDSAVIATEDGVH
jgi:hypothetical protein